MIYTCLYIDSVYIPQKILLDINQLQLPGKYPVITEYDQFTTLLRITENW